MQTTFVYDFDQINQTDVFTFADGTDVTVDGAGLSTLYRIQAQLEDRRREYLTAWRCGCDGRFHSADSCDFHRDAVSPADDALIWTPLWRRVRDAISTHPITVRRNKVRDANRKMFSLLFQDEIWRTADGRELRLEDMDVRHLGNTIQFLERNAPKLALAHQIDSMDVPNGGSSRAFADTQGDWMARTPLMRRMQELHDAASPLAHAAGAVRQKARVVHHKVTGRWPS